MATRVWALCAVVALVLMTSAPLAAAKVLGIDLGSENIKVAIVQPGRVPITMVTNEMSRRKSPGAVCFYNGERLLGEEAQALEARFPEKLFVRMREMLGASNDPSVAQRALDRLRLPNKLVPKGSEGSNRTTLGLFSPDDSKVYTVEELMAMTLQYVHKIGEDFGESSIKDVVLTVPAFFGQAERESLLVAADIAGLNVLSLVGEHAAAALQWGIDKDFVNNTKDVILYDMGAGSVTAALVHYSSFSGKEFGKTKNFGQFEVKAVTWDAEVGAADLDMLLVEHFAAEFNEKVLKGKDDVLKYPKSVAKLRKQCKKTKEILSANNAAPISVESILDDHDFRSTITREQFEKMENVKGIFERVAKPLVDLIEQTGVQLEDVEAIELLGGGTRIPGVLAALSKAIGGRGLDRHIDSDEAVAFGAGLHAANISTSFRVRKFGANDAASYALNVQLGSEGAAEEPVTTEEAADAADGEELSTKRMKLLPRFKKIPVKRVVALNNITSDTSLTVSYEDTNLPRGVTVPEIATYQISGMEAVAEKYNATGKVNVHFVVSTSGTMSISKAEAIVELPDPPAVEKKVNKTATAGAANTTNTTDAANTTETPDSSKPEESSEEKPKDVEPEHSDTDADKEPSENSNSTQTEEEAKAKAEKPKKKRTTRIPLKVAQVWSALPIPTIEETADSMDMMQAFKKQDRIKAEAAEAKNKLESYIIATRDRMNEEESVATVSTAEQREEIVSDLMDAEDWLYMDGEHAPVDEYRSRLAALKAKSDPIFERVKEAEERPPAVESGRKFIEVTRSVVAAWNSTKPWINETDKEELLKEVELFETWLDEKVEAQSKKEPHEEPAFKASKVGTKVSPLEAKLAKLKKTPKPKPPPTATTNSTNTTETNTTNTTVETEPQEPVNPDEVVIEPPNEDDDVVIEPPSGDEEVDKDEL